MNEVIVNKNLAKMLSYEADGMLNFLLNESIGGSAGTWNGFNCIGANFNLDKQTGLIIDFSNYSENVHPRASFRIACDREVWNKEIANCNLYFLILECYLRAPISEPAEENLKESIKRYNEIGLEQYRKIHGKDLKEVLGEGLNNLGMLLFWTPTERTQAYEEVKNKLNKPSKESYEGAHT